MVLVKLGVVLFVIVVGVFFVTPSNWWGVPPEARVLPEQQMLPGLANTHAKMERNLLEAAQSWARDFQEEFKVSSVESAGTVGNGDKTTTTTRTLKGTLLANTIKQSEATEKRASTLGAQAVALFRIRHAEATKNAELIAMVRKVHEKDLPTEPLDIEIAEALIKKAATPELRQEWTNKNWGLLAQLGINDRLTSLDDATRSSFLPYGLSGVIFGAAIVFFAFIGFDSISTHSEEAINPQRDLPFGIIASLVLCSFLYMGVAAVITGMIPYPEIDTEAAVASAFSDLADRTESPTFKPILKASAMLIAIGGLAGMTSVLLITFLSQARIFLAMARDGLLPNSIFGRVHEKFKTPHISTMFTGGIMMVITAFTPIRALEEMVNIGTLFAFVVVCGAVLLLRIRRPEAHRPFRCPALYVVAPVGIVVNLLLMLFLPVDTWIRLVVWLVVGLVFYFSFGYWHSVMSPAPPSHSGPHPAPTEGPNEHVRAETP